MPHDPTPLYELLTLTTTDFGADALEEAAEKLFTWGLGRLTAEQAGVTWGQELGYARSHCLCLRGAGGTWSTALNNARHVLASTPQRARPVLASLLTKTSGCARERALVEAEVALSEARRLRPSELLVQELWDEATRHLQEHRVQGSAVDDALEQAVQNLLTARLRYGDGKRLPRSAHHQQPLLLSAMRLAFLDGSPVISDRSNLLSALRALRLDDIHPDAWQFRRDVALTAPVTAFRETALCRLNWLRLYAQVCDDTQELPTTPVAHPLVLAALAEIEIRARHEQPKPHPRTHADVLAQLVQVLHREGQKPLPLRSNALRALQGDTPDKTVAAVRLQALEVHHVAAERAPRPFIPRTAS